METSSIIKKSIHVSLKQTLPVFVGFLPVGLVYGILMESNGYSFLWSGACSLLVLAGSLQYLMIDFLSGDASYLTVAVMAALINSRHVFYGIPFLETWNSYGTSKWFLIYALPDETFSVDLASREEEGTNLRAIYFFNALLILLYWVSVSMLGGLVGQLITFDTAGMDFALTALMIVIMLGQIRASSSLIPVIIAAVSSLGCLFLLGPSVFILPSLVITVTVLILLRDKIEVKDND